MPAKYYTNAESRTKNQSVKYIQESMRYVSVPFPSAVVGFFKVAMKRCMNFLSVEGTRKCGASI